MHKAVKITLLGIVLVVSFLLWPGFSSDLGFNCEGVSEELLARGGECPVVSSINFSDVQLGGGWRWFNERNCVIDGKLQLATYGICPASVSKERAEEVPFILIGPLVITAIVGIFLFKPWQIMPRRSR